MVILYQFYITGTAQIGVYLYCNSANKAEKAHVQAYGASIRFET